MMQTGDLQWIMAAAISIASIAAALYSMWYVMSNTDHFDKIVHVFTTGALVLCALPPMLKGAETMYAVAFQGASVKFGLQAIEKALCYVAGIWLIGFVIRLIGKYEAQQNIFRTNLLHRAKSEIGYVQQSAVKPQSEMKAHKIRVLFKKCKYHLITLWNGDVDDMKNNIEQSLLNSANGLNALDDVEVIDMPEFEINIKQILGVRSLHFLKIEVQQVHNMTLSYRGTYNSWNKDDNFVKELWQFFDIFKSATFKEDTESNTRAE